MYISCTTVNPLSPYVVVPLSFLFPRFSTPPRVRIPPPCTPRRSRSPTQHSPAPSSSPRLPAGQWHFPPRGAQLCRLTAWLPVGSKAPVQTCMICCSWICSLDVISPMLCSHGMVLFSPGHLLPEVHHSSRSISHFVLSKANFVGLSSPCTHFPQRWAQSTLSGAAPIMRGTHRRQSNAEQQNVCSKGSAVTVSTQKLLTSDSRGLGLWRWQSHQRLRGPFVSLCSTVMGWFCMCRSEPRDRDSGAFSRSALQEIKTVGWGEKNWNAVLL